MTDLEISKALALAIGWSEAAFRIRDNKLLLQQTEHHFARSFDYRDWNVIGPIAEKFDAFPRSVGCKNWACCAEFNRSVYADTPQKAIALAVIGAKK